VAKINLKSHHSNERVRLLHGNLLEPLPEPVDLIVANLPYVKNTNLIRVNTYGFEPTLALNGGQDGLSIIIQLCYQASNKINNNGCLLLEIEPEQIQMVLRLLNNLFPSATVKVFNDFNGLGRIISLILAS
jgi:release factor glutamine methyltransferase